MTTIVGHLSSNEARYEGAVAEMPRRPLSPQ